MILCRVTRCIAVCIRAVVHITDSVFKSSGEQKYSLLHDEESTDTSKSTAAQQGNNVDQLLWS